MANGVSGSGREECGTFSRAGRTLGYQGKHRTGTAVEENRASAGDEETKAILPTFQTHCRPEDAVGDNGKFPFRSSLDAYGAVFNAYECLPMWQLP